MAITVCFSVFLLVNILQLNALPAFEYNQTSTAIVPKSIGQPWPMPAKYSSNSDLYSINSENFKFIATGESCDVLYQAFVRYRRILFGKDQEVLKFKPHGKHSKAGSFDILYVNQLNRCDTYPSLNSDESYTLSANASGLHLQANSVWGALRGLETFSEIVYQLDDGTFVINGTAISDVPRFKHRGLLLDTSRHYLSLKTIKDNLDAMAQVKYNVFHWHIVDDQSFPYQSSMFPTMSQEGAFDQRHIYSQSDIKSIIEYARLRGIRVIPEFDSPGHTQSWGKAIDNLLTKCYSGGKFNGNYGPIDPSVNTTFTFLINFFKEIAELFPDKYIHLGGDEVSFSCWKSNPDITKFMAEMGFASNYSRLEEYYMQNLLDIISDLKKGYIIWQEVIDNGATVSADTVVEVWKSGYPAELEKITKLGYQTILSSCWYLNYIKYGSDWLPYYMCDPHNFNGTAKQKELVVGGEACMWGEYVDDTNLMSRTWPRASVVAERLWSAVDSISDTAGVQDRLEEHRCRMVKRGFPAESINGPGFCRDEFVPHE
ncbi:hypothetical protein ScPMuIL_017589 [Solemya velum]